MSIHRDLVAGNKLFGEFDKLAGFEGISSADVSELKGTVLAVAAVIGPHLEHIPRTFSQYTDHGIQHLLNIADHVHDFLPRQQVNDKSVVAVNALELTFLWLAILLHDMGMFVAEADERQKLLDSDEYRDYLRRNRAREQAAKDADDCGHTVRAAAIRDALFAEFIRRRHAERVHAYIGKYFSDHGVSKLRFRETDLSQDVGRLCESHNWGVHQSRDSRAPQQCVAQLGKRDLIGKTPVNYAYLACCLRLGDILDFDRSRTPLSAFHQIHFTEALSLEEWNKHLSIKGIEVTEHRAHYVAECATPGDRVAVHHFLDWVDRELQDCTRLIGDFPAGLTDRYRVNLVPIVDRHQVRMKDPRYVAGDFRFQLEYDQIMRLLMDKSLYPDETLFLRELLQNSLDACRYQKARAEEAGMGQQYIPRIQAWDHSTEARDPNHPQRGPRIIFQDNGVGMSLEQIENFFMRVGKSFYRSAEFEAERERLEEKGIHLDACSQFGIGFLSCFLGGDRIEVETYQYGSEPLKITIEGPKRYFLIERLPKPAHVEIPFKSPADPADDRPPRYAGTKITVHLRDGWHQAAEEPDTDLVYATLDAVAVNQEIPILVTSADQNLFREIPARRWDNTAPEFPGSHPVNLVRSIAFAASVFSLSDFDESLCGRGAIWFLSDQGTPVVRRGYLLIPGTSYLEVHRFIVALRDFCRSFAGVSGKDHMAIMKALERIRANSGTGWPECGWPVAFCLIGISFQTRKPSRNWNN